ncbi:hypothetical protein ACFY4K_34900 [Streptomyces leeuwenhoekii]|uniref:hypothetical protein n=1 Tax=Streptomyces leeuwenhoekii TaxID=1437453 RepID=UPI0036CB4C50
MNLRQRYADYLAKFSEDAKKQIADHLVNDGFGNLRKFGFTEDEQGVWAEVEISLSGEVVDRWGSDLYTRRTLVIWRNDGPVDDAPFGASLLGVAVMEDLATCGRRP